MQTALAQLRTGSPDEAGLDTKLSAHGDQLMSDAIAGGVFPGAVVLVARAGIVAWHQAFGKAQVVPRARPMTRETIFDLASLTKVIGTLPGTLTLWRTGVVALDIPVEKLLTEFAGVDSGRVTIRQLLAHTAGFPSWRAVYLTTRNREEVLDALRQIPLQHPPGTLVEYSDLGIMLLGLLLERVTGTRLDAFLRQVVFAPLGLTQTTFVPPRAWWDRCAATEVGHAYERQKVHSTGGVGPEREHALCGEVHDGNAYYAMEGVSAHAGLFSTAWEVGTVALQWIRPSPYLPDHVIAEATRDQTQGARGYPRGLGWVLQHPDAFFAALGPRAFGHTGFTGTSVAIDPDADLIAVLLTNRVHPRADNMLILEFRRRFHELVSQAIRRRI